MMMAIGVEKGEIVVSDAPISRIQKQCFTHSDTRSVERHGGFGNDDGGWVRLNPYPLLFDPTIDQPRLLIFAQDFKSRHLPPPKSRQTINQLEPPGRAVSRSNQAFRMEVSDSIY